MVKYTKIRSGDSRAFSLIEMLVVIIIIGMLLSVLLPAYLQSRESAKRRRLESEKQILSGAVISYRSEYGRWPCDDPGNDLSPRTYSNDNWKVLDYLSSTEPGKNPRGIRFLVLSEFLRDEQGNVLDPWLRKYSFEFNFSNDTVTVR
jgi:prepilin-type N-terminal cleavage/methylation domain-containing protein